MHMLIPCPRVPHSGLCMCLVHVTANITSEGDGFSFLFKLEYYCHIINVQ